jgi:hypothetical protein
MLIAVVVNNWVSPTPFFTPEIGGQIGLGVPTSKSLMGRLTKRRQKPNVFGLSLFPNCERDAPCSYNGKLTIG